MSPYITAMILLPHNPAGQYNRAFGVAAEADFVIEACLLNRQTG